MTVHSAVGCLNTQTTSLSFSRRASPCLFDQLVYPAPSLVSSSRRFRQIPKKKRKIQIQTRNSLPFFSTCSVSRLSFFFSDGTGFAEEADAFWSGRASMQRGIYTSAHSRILENAHPACSLSTLPKVSNLCLSLINFNLERSGLSLSLSPQATSESFATP